MKKKVATIIGAGALAIAAPVVMHFEGKSNETYLDPVGIPTVCYGHTATAEPGEHLSDEQCETLLEEDLQVALRGVAGCVETDLEPHQWAAVVSWTYNVGVGNACSSTLVKQINAGHRPAVWCWQLLRWTYADGRELAGLVRRREKEYQICIGEGQ